MTAINKRVALVLGGGGLKGFAHIGVLRALEERGIKPSLYAGASIGALLGAGYATGLGTDEMARRASALRRRDLFRLNHVGVLLGRMRAASIYQAEPLRALAESVAPDDLRFDQLDVPVLVTTVDVERGTQVVWGTPGLRDVRVADAIYASCALPGFFPPGEVGGRVCIDGGTIDNLPVSIAAVDADVVIAVDVGNADLTHATEVHAQGFSAVFMRAASVMMHALQELPLATWAGPPMLLIRPRVGHVPWLSFSHTDDVIREGYRAAVEALAHWDTVAHADGGVFPRRRVSVHVDRTRCTGCGLCVALEPRLMALDGERKAYAVTTSVEWSPAGGDFVRHCPAQAITVASDVALAAD
jgi:NTE family protein